MVARLSAIASRETRTRQIATALRGSPLSAAQIAQRIGTSPNTVSVYLSWLKSDGIVRQPQRGLWELAA